jgi:MFS family permease
LDPILAALLYDGNGALAADPDAKATPTDNTYKGPIVGTIYDRYGPRWLMLGGSFLHVFGIMMASLGTEYYQILLAQGVCSGIGVSAIFQPCKSTF